MSILLCHQLSPEAQRSHCRAYRSRLPKAELAIIRIQSLLGLSDEELLRAVKRVTGMNSDSAIELQPEQR